jgi:hypothetical protein
MNGEVQLIVTSGSIDTATYSGTLSTQNVAGLTVFSLSGNTSAPFPCNDPSILTLVGGVLTVEDADVNGTANIIGWDANTCEITIDNAIQYSGVVPADDACTITYTVSSIEQKYLDLFENESISQNWKFQDLSNFTAQGAFSREFRVPYSYNNQQALGAIVDVNSNAGAENYFFYKLPAEIRVDTLPIATGYLRVRKVYKQLNRISEIELAFYAETPDLVRTIGEKKLSDIAALADLNEAITYANVTTSTADRIWTLCDRGQKWSGLPISGFRSLTDVNNPVFPSDLTPAINWWYLLSNIVKEAGFDLVAGTLQNILQDYWMPWCNTPQLSVVDISNQYFFRVYPTVNNTYFGFGASIPMQADAEVYDNNNNFNTSTWEYTVPVAGEYTFSGLLKSDPASVSNVSWNVGLFINTVASYYTSGTISTTGLQYVPFTFTVSLSQGDTIALALQLVNESLTTLYAGDGSISSTYWQMSNVNPLYGSPINYAANAPDMRQIDLVNDIIKMHNCAIVPSRVIPNRIAIVPQNSYLGTGDVLDWTSKLDVSKDVVISSTVDLQKAKVEFTYAAGDDAYSKLYTANKRTYGDYKVEGYTINPSTAPSNFAIGEQKIQLVTRSTPAGVVPNYLIPIPCFYDDNLEFVPPGPRCLYNATTNAVIALLNDGTNSASPLTGVEVLNHYSSIFVNIDDEDLNWAPETPPHDNTVTANPYNNLFNKYWRTYMNELYSPEARIMEASFALNLKDILSFTFADKIWINDSYWRILEIQDYKVGLNESTKVKLLKFVDYVEDCSSVPFAVQTNGEVLFVDANEDIVEPTQDCCSRYGYFWDEINGVCWAFNNGGQFRTSFVNSNNAPRNGVEQAFANLSINTKSVINGDNINIIGNNPNSLLVGKDLNLTDAVNGSNLLGKNTITNLPGLHLGGGYRAGNPLNGETGWAQTGTVIMHYKDAWIDAQIYDLLVEGIAARYIELPDDTLWSCVMNATILDTNTGNYCIGQYSFGLQVIGGLANATAITALNEVNGTAYTFVYDVDTTTNTAQHRINLQVNGLGITTVTFIVTASIQYQQNKSA